MKRITAIAIAFTAMLGSFYVGDSAAGDMVVSASAQVDVVALCAEAVQLADAGEDAEQIADWLSHSDLSMTERRIFWHCFYNGGDK